MENLILKNLFYYIFVLIFAVSLIRIIISTILLFWSIRWLKKNLTFTYGNYRCDHDFFIIIPVLREQKILTETINHFLKINYPLEKITLMLVSTEKEFLEKQYFPSKDTTTIDIINELKSSINKSYGREIIKHLHYPDSTGKMVDQLNFAFKHTLNSYSKNKSRLFVAIYNADSRPNLNTLKLVSGLSGKTDYRAYQQSSIFFENFDKLEKENGFWVGKYLKTNAVLQTRWTLAYEIPGIIKQSFFLNKFKKRIFLSHCVGHGLFLRGDLIDEIREIPTGTVTEDLFLGYVLSLLGEPINPLPVMESAEMPDRFIKTLKQKYVWFFGPLDHTDYENFFRKKFPQKANYLLLKWFTLQGLVPAFTWLISGWAFLYLLFYPILINDNKLFIAAIILFFIHAPLSYSIILYHFNFLNDLCSNFSKISKSEYLWVALFSPFVVFIHSIPPIFTILVKIRYILTRQEPLKPKTER